MKLKQYLLIKKVIIIAKLGTCKNCGAFGRITEHHKIKRSKQTALIKCKNNLIDLCDQCHYVIHHSPAGHKLDINIQLSFQNFLETRFLKEFISREEVKEVLEITDRETNRLLKTLMQHNGLYVREDLIRCCMGGKIITQGDLK
ncbi:hypothetical protein [Clostridium neonatale]|uniref:hypothetical protein n=1 Tax=Clostridium neonatale TaxID=137838 RepID=UPI00291BE1D6|nr:hypothetical protein CNEO4_240021 [Clostridium neonatale]